jgi:hypothetical protein
VCVCVCVGGGGIVTFCLAVFFVSFLRFVFDRFASVQLDLVWFGLLRSFLLRWCRYVVSMGGHDCSIFQWKFQRPRPKTKVGACCVNALSVHVLAN